MSAGQQATTGHCGETVVLVDDEGREAGLGDKVECHRSPGRLHRALTCLLFDGRGRLLFARRSPSKATWPGYWDATVATHQARGESDEAAANRRVVHELQVEPADLVRPTAIRYRAQYSDRWCEHERCAVLLGRIAEPQVSRLAPAPEEIDDLSWVEAGQLAAFIASKPVTPWFLLAWEALPGGQGDALGGYPGRCAGADG